MGEERVVRSRYEYVHEKGNWPSSVVDIHHVRVLRTGAVVKILILCLGSLVLFLLVKGNLDIFILCYLLTGVLFLISLLRKQYWLMGGRICGDHTGIWSSTGTHYRSGRVIRRLVPIDKILKPVLNECVTPLTCYWSLALLVREEGELVLVFKELHPSLEMLAPIWKALCAGTDSE